MDRYLAVTFDVLRVRIIDTGVWCDTCALPSAVRVEILVDGNAILPSYLTEVYCDDCGAI